MSGIGLEGGPPAREAHIDGLRAVAILPIVLFHAAPGLAPGGFVGVDVFFVISGFLITRLIAGEIERGEFSFPRFYLRRARRIMPALVVMAAVATLVAAWLLPPPEFRQYGGVLGASVLFIVNLFTLNGAGYFEAPMQASPLAHLWSLAVEEQFYLVWPFLLMGMMWTFWRGRRGASVVLLALSLAAAQVTLIGHNDLIAFFMLPTRAWEFLAGAVLTMRFPPPLSRRMADGAVVVGLLLILAAVVFLNGRSLFPGLAAIPPVLGAALVLWGAPHADARIAAPLRWGPVAGIGLISYSLYLWHWPVLVFGRVVAQHPLSAVEGLVLSALCVPLAWASWRYVEQPCRRLPVAPAWRAAGLALAPLLVLFAVGAWSFFGHGLPWRMTPGASRALAAAEADVNPWRAHCLVQGFGVSPRDCRSGAADMPVKVIVWGDSHADALTPGVFAWARDHGLAVRQITQGGCPPLVGVQVVRRGGTPCAGRGALDAIAHTDELKLIVLAARWPLYMDAEPKYDAVPVRLVTPDLEPVALGVALDRTLAAIAASGTKARVVVIGPVPELTFSPPECRMLAAQAGLPAGRCASAEAGPVLRRARTAEAELGRALARHPDVAWVQPSAGLCRAGRCAAETGETPLYSDDDHLAASAARALVPGWLEASLGAGGWTEPEGLGRAAVVSPRLTQEFQDFRLTNAAARVRVIPEARNDYAVSVTGPGAERFRTRKAAGAVVVDGGRPAPWSRLRCDAAATGADLPLVTVRLPRDARLEVDGTTYGEVGPTASLSLTVRGCGAWRLGATATDLAIAAEGGAAVDAARVNGRLSVSQSGPGRVTVAAGEATETVIDASGKGRVRYSGDAALVSVDLRRGGEARLDRVTGLVEGSNDGSGRLIFFRRDGQRFCGGC
jgi:peptidoglycan/LPS O-acetylase OafA/YrhL